MKASEEDEAMIKELQKTAVFRNTNMAAAQLVSAQADAMRAAASNTNAGPAMAFMGMNMAQQAGGANAQNLFAMGAAGQAQPVQQAVQEPWQCACGAINTGKFCPECGSPKPAAEWQCACGTVNKGKFCPECGAKRP